MRVCVVGGKTLIKGKIVDKSQIRKDDRIPQFLSGVATFNPYCI
jgi:hypothetical protein